MDAKEQPNQSLMLDDDFAHRFFETDLSDLPKQTKKRGRHPILMVAVMLFSALLMWMFADDTRYFFEPNAPRDQGDTVQWRKEFQENPSFRPKQLRHNTYVRLAGLTAFRVEAVKAKQAFLKLTYVPVYVHLKDERPAKPSNHLVHLTVSGRLLDLTKTSEYSTIQRYYAKNFDLPTGRAFMLVAEERPKDHWWVLILQALFALFIAGNGTMLIRTLRQS